MKATFNKYILNFKNPSGTSRGILKEKESWFIKISNGLKQGIGECSVIRGLSCDDMLTYEKKLQWACDNIELGLDELFNALMEYPSIQFGLETAFKSIQSDSSFELFPSKFTEEKDAIAINGLIWMGEEQFMKDQIKTKIEAGFNCIKMKIGAIDFDIEYTILKSIRKEYSANDIELRVDANGAFTVDNALDKLKRLSELSLHSIEQPIKQGQLQEMASLCEKTPLPIALDEELIGVFDVTDKQKVIQTINPHYIILKPSLVGGYNGSEEWIALAMANDCGWWITSALESNVGLNAIAQWTYTLDNKMPQGLGTGDLYTNNFDSPLHIKNSTLRYSKGGSWNFNL